MSNVLFQGGTRLYDRDRAELQELAARTEHTRENTNRLRREGELDPLRRDLLSAQIRNQEAATEHHGASSEQQRASAGHQVALSELNRAQADTILRKADKEDRVAAAIAESVGGKSLVSDDGAEASGITDLAFLGQKVMAAGDLEKGEKLIKMAADLKKSEATTRASVASEVVRKTNAQIKKLEFMRQVFSGVTDPASHARALLLLQGNSLTADEEIPKGLQTYDPKMIGQFLAGSKTALDKKQVEIASFNAASADQSRKAAQTTREYLAGLTKRRTEAYVERAANVTKTGDEKTVPLPGSPEIKLMRQELQEDGIDFEDDDDEAVMELAEQAKILTTRNPSLSRKEAITRVIGDAKKRGDLTPGSNAKILGVGIPGTKGKAQYKQTEGTVAMPAPLPDSADGLVEGNYYRGSSGQIKQYKDGAFVAVSQRVPKPVKGK